ncbi:MAG TPA: hypothetical protein VIP11_06360 [Gemmatimonadaceae bacterium]
MTVRASGRPESRREDRTSHDDELVVIQEGNSVRAPADEPLPPPNSPDIPTPGTGTVPKPVKVLMSYTVMPLVVST